MNKKIKEFFQMGFVLAIVHFLWHTSIKDIKDNSSHKQDSTNKKIGGK